jgi:cell division septal protein FtsQ
MVYAGRPGMWEDWVKFQAAASRRRREAKEEAAREILRRKARAAKLVEFIVIGIATAILAGLIIYGIVLYMLHLR